MDDLILATLKRRDVAARERFKAALDSIKGRAEEKLLGLFESVASRKPVAPNLKKRAVRVSTAPVLPGRAA